MIRVHLIMHGSHVGYMLLTRIEWEAFLNVWMEK